MATTDDLERLFLIQSETLATEFKAWLDIAVPSGRAVLAKAAIALANHGGGTVVLGMREAADAPISSHARPQGMPRYTADAVNAAVNKYADPHIHCDVVHLNHPVTGVEHAFVVVPGGHRVPIMSVRDADGVIAKQRVYVRKPGPKSEEPFNSEEWGALMQRCITNGRESMLDSIRIILQGQSLEAVEAKQVNRLEEFTKQSFERWQERVKPLPKDSPARFPLGSYEQAYQILDVAPAEGLAALKERLRKADEVKHTGWGPFVFVERKPIGPVPAGDAIEAWLGHPDEGDVDGHHADFWRARPDGMLYELRSLDEDFNEKVPPGTALDLTTPIWRIGETLLYVARLARLFGDDPEIAMHVEYRGLMGRKMKSLFEWRYLSYDRECVIDSVRMGGKARASVIESNTAEVLFPLLRPLYEAFDFAPFHGEMITQELSKFRNRRY